MRKANALVLLLFLLLSDFVYAGSAKWDINPATNDWNTAANWTPNTVPNGPNDTATFDLTNVADLTVHSSVELNTVDFLPIVGIDNTITVGDASSSDVVSFTLSGIGIVTDPYNQFYYIEAEPTFATGGVRNAVYLKNNATGAVGAKLSALGGTGADSAGGQVQFLDDSTLGPGFASAFAGENGGSGGEIWFLDNSSASKEGDISRGSVNAFASGAGSTAGQVFFKGTSTAGSASVAASGGRAAGVEGGKIFFLESSDAGDNSVFAYSGGASVPDSLGGRVVFSDTASAGSAELWVGGSGISLGGTIEFLGDSSGGTAQVVLNDADNAVFDISGHNPPGISIGSLEGPKGTVTLGANTLIVGNNNLTTTYSGLIQGSGSLTKIGTGTLTLKGKNNYSGGTTVKGGTLNVTNQRGSVTGTGPVNVRSGVLAGEGIITGRVTVDRRGSLGRSGNKDNHLTIEGPLNFLPGSRYTWGLNAAKATADQVTASGVTIASGTHFKVIASGDGTLAVGTTFVTINNTSANPISGTFAEIPDGGTITVGNNTFQANYEGGDGNDLTLTVIP